MSRCGTSRRSRVRLTLFAAVVLCFVGDVSALTVRSRLWGADGGDSDGQDGVDAVEEEAQDEQVAPIEFRAPQMTPVQFLFISSSTEGKIVYTQLRNFRSPSGRTFPLIDSGLAEPCGIAFDRTRGDLYVADRSARSIFKYSVQVAEEKDDDGKSEYRLVTDGERVTVLSGRDVEWVSVSSNGDVFYSDQGSNSINKISAKLVDNLASGIVLAADVSFVSEKQLEIAAGDASSDVAASSSVSAEDAKAAAASKRAGRGASWSASGKSVMTLYEGALNPHVSTPAGITSDGIHLFWANSQGGNVSGSAVLGEVSPKTPLAPNNGSEPLAFPATVLASNAVNAYGVAKSNTMVIYATQTEVPAGWPVSGAVYGVDALSGVGAPNAFTTSVQEPRGLAFDGDNTIYVADKLAGSVWSFPVGRLIEDVPLTLSVELTGAYGVALLSAEDPAFLLKATAWSRHNGVLNSWLLTWLSLFLVPASILW